MSSKFLLQLIEWKKQASFSIRNLKRSTIKEFYAKEEQKRKNSNINNNNNNNNNIHQQQLNVATVANVNRNNKTNAFHHASSRQDDNQMLAKPVQAIDREPF